MEETGKKSYYLIGGGVLLLILVVLACFLHVQLWESKTYELGTSPKTSVYHYMLGSPISLNGAKVDISKVDYMTVGTYTATVSLKGKTYSYEVNIVDTTPPAIAIKEDLSDVNIGIDYSYAEIYDSITDLAGPVEIWASVDGKDAATFLFPSIQEYQIVLYAKDINGNQSSKEFTISAVDTIAPTIIGFESDPYYAVGDTYSLLDFVTELSDNSGSYDAVLTIDGQAKNDSISFDDVGQHKLEITAKDASGNEVVFEETIHIDYRPELYGVSDKKILLSKEYNLLEGILAWDNEDGFISNQIVCTGTLDLENAGDYTIEYSISDQHGLTASQSAVITVGTGSYDTNTAVYPDDLLQKMLASDYFQYELLSEPDPEAAATLMYPCQLAMKQGDSRGSGFIYAIDENYLYVGTMAHCTTKDFAGHKVTIWLYNPTYDSKQSHNSTKRALEDLTVVECARQYGNNTDKAMFTISLDEIPMDVLIYLKEVNKTNESNNSTANGIYTDTIYVAKDIYTAQFKKTFTVCTKSGEDFDAIINHFPQYNNKENWLLTNEGGVHGQSGSLLYDGYGNPVASLSGRMIYKNVTVGRHVWFNKFKELYEELRQ